MASSQEVYDASIPHTEPITVFVQDACLQHRYIRSRDLSAIVERPERLRAVSVGISAIIARLEGAVGKEALNKTSTNLQSSEEALVDAITNLHLEPRLGGNVPIKITSSQASSKLLEDPAIKFVHGDIDGDIYLETLAQWIEQSRDKIAKDGSEIPEGYSQGDLYLCPTSLNAIQGAIGTVCESVDEVIAASRTKLGAKGSRRAFVAIRPPGHHCGEKTPSGFCFVNNVAVGAAYAHLNYGIKRVVIFDIDLHHGNGTQSVVWQINEESYRKTLESEGSSSTAETGPQFFYGSLHDILSFPCEDGKPELVQAASVSIHRAHGQYIENIHLQTYQSDDHFWNELYSKEYSKLFLKAKEFLDHTGGPGDDVLFFVSCGMDACEHEYESMSRHNRKVPTSFYYRFAQDTVKMSETYGRGRVISVLEGGYSDRALISGTMAHLSGLIDQTIPIDESWWNANNLDKIEVATKKRRGSRPSLNAQSLEPWLERTLSILGPLDQSAAAVTTSTKSSPPIPASTRSLRDRNNLKPKAFSPEHARAAKPVSSSARGGKQKTTAISVSNIPQPTTLTEDLSSNSAESANSVEDASSTDTTKKLPKIILRIGKPPENPPQ